MEISTKNSDKLYSTQKIKQNKFPYKNPLLFAQKAHVLTVKLSKRVDAKFLAKM